MRKLLKVLDMLTILTMVMASCMYTYIKIYQIVNLKCQLYHNKVFLNKSTTLLMVIYMILDS